MPVPLAAPVVMTVGRAIIAGGARRAAKKYGDDVVKQVQKSDAFKELKGKTIESRKLSAKSSKNNKRFKAQNNQVQENAAKRQRAEERVLDLDNPPIEEIPLRFDMNAGGLLSDDRATYKDGGFPDLNKDGKTTYADVLIGRGVRDKKAIGGLVKKLFKLAKKKQPKEVKEQDIDAILNSLSDEQMEKLSPVEIEQLLDMDLAKSGVDNIPAKSTKKDIDDILDNLTDKEIENLTPIEREQLLDLELDKYGIGGRKTKKEGGSIDDQMMMVMSAPMESEMESDEDMEDGYTRFIMEEALTEDEEDMLMSKLEQDEELAMIFDKVIDVAQEFAGAGPVEGPGSGVSDSIPARLSDGEFVFTAKAVEEIGEDTLMSMMKDAEAKADERQGKAIGGVMSQQEAMDENKNVLYGQQPQADINEEIQKKMLGYPVIR